VETTLLQFVIVALAMSLLAQARAQNTFETLHSANASLEPNGELVEGSDGDFYGTTSGGGRNGVGSVFKITPAGLLTVLHSFDGTTGVYPQAGLVQGTDGAFYGSTRGNGYALEGTLFRITSHGEFTTLHVFNGSNGEAPNGGLVRGGDGALYGTTLRGGSHNKGTVFKITLAGKLTTLHSFNGTKGAFPVSGLVQGRDGTFYGATSRGGADDGGTVFKITSMGVLTVLSESRGFSEKFLLGNDGAFYVMDRSQVIAMSEAGVLTVLYTISSYDGYFEGRLAQDGAGNLYGVINDFSAVPSKVFKLSPDGAFDLLYTFSREDGHTVLGGLTLGSDGALYGTAAPYDGDHGTVFRMTPDGTFTLLHSLISPDGNGSRALLQDSHGNFYGITEQGGAFGQGTVFKITTDGVHTVLHSFDDDWFALPQAGLVQDDDGNLYGLAGIKSIYWDDHRSRAFKISTDGNLTELASFWGQPVSELVKGSDGCFYCATYRIYDDAGPVLKITPSGDMTVLHTFVGSPEPAQNVGMIQGRDGDIYGTTDFMGDAGNDVWGYGRVFKITPAGVFTTLHVFNGADGSSPRAKLVQGSDGTLYGTTEYGGIHNRGSLFKITPAGEFTTLHSFNGTDGERPRTQLVLGSDGHLYGACNVSYQYPDLYSYGTVFKISPAGKFANLVFFRRTKTIRSADTLVGGADGNLYGVSRWGGSESRGALFQITPAGKCTLLHSFRGDDGSYPTHLIQGRDGAFYGTADTMTVWRFRVAQKPEMVDPGPQQHHVGQEVNLPMVASENPAKFLVKGLPKGLRYDAATQSIVGQATTPKLDKNKQPAAHEVKIRAVNGLGAGPEITVNWIILPLPPELSGSFEGLVAPQAEVNDSLGGSLRFTVSPSGAVTGKLWAGGRLQSFKGNLTVAAGGASAVLHVTIPHKNPAEVVTLELTLGAGLILPDSRILRNGGEAAVDGWRGESLPSAALLGTFHAALQATELAENIPEGAGWAVLKISSKGVAVWTGRLADGSAFTASQITGPDGRAPCFAMLYRGNGALRGWTQVDADSGDLDDVGGLSWLKKPEPGDSRGRVYKEGIPPHTLSLQGGRYALNEVGLILDFVAPGPGSVSFTGGGLLQPVEQPFELLAKNGIRLPKGAPVKLSLMPKTGLITTSFALQADGKSLSVKGTGLLVPRRGQGLGQVLVPQSEENNSALRSAKMTLHRTP
jgi:uncharacterized repeat protein (TIGR03803 family)